MCLSVKTGAFASPLSSKHQRRRTCFVF